MQKQKEIIKYDIGLAPASLASTNSTGEYLEFQTYREAVAVLSVADVAESQTAILAIQEATDNTGTSAQTLSGATVTITGGANSNIVKATLSTVSVNDTLVVNGLTFTAKASADHANRQWDQSGTDTADATDLTTLLNSTTGPPGLTATSAAGVVTITSDDGETEIDISETGSTITIATVNALAVVDLSH